jgi:RNA polymerase sigma factor (sigma-70 family)
VTENQGLHELIKMIGNGDLMAFDALYMKMRQPLCKKILWKYGPTLTKEDAEDAVQNTFLKIRQYASSYNGQHNEASAYQWINQIVFSEALKIVNANKRLLNSLDDPNGTQNKSEYASAVPERSRVKGDLYREGQRSVEDRVEMQITLEKIFSSIHQRFTAEEQNMLKMRFVLDYTFEQIGRVIGKTKVRAKQIIDALVERIRVFIGVDLTQS